MSFDNIRGVSKAGYDIKGSLVRAYVHEIGRLGLTKEVAARIPPETRQMMDELPLHSAWTDATHIEELINAVEALGGIAAVRTVTSRGQMSLVPLLRPILSGLLRLFGTSPATLLSRFSKLSSTNVRGPEFSWTSESEKKGELRVFFPMRKNLPRNVFVGFESGIANILELCNVKGSVEDARIVDHGSTGLIRVSWS